jgi:hemoglobin
MWAEVRDWGRILDCRTLAPGPDGEYPSTMSSPPAPSVPPVPLDAQSSPYDVLGGREVVLALAERFYDHMERFEPALAEVHRRDAEGRIERTVRERFGLFLIGWLGGPQDYMDQHGHPRLRMRHAHVPVNEGLRDAWVRSMSAAMDETPMPAPVRTYLDARFLEVADFLRNTPD